MSSFTKKNLILNISFYHNKYNNKTTRQQETRMPYYDSMGNQIYPYDLSVEKMRDCYYPNDDAFLKSRETLLSNFKGETSEDEWSVCADDGEASEDEWSVCADDGEASEDEDEVDDKPREMSTTDDEDEDEVEVEVEVEDEDDVSFQRFGDQQKEIATLREELGAVHRAYLSGMKMKDELNEEISQELKQCVRDNNTLEREKMNTNNHLRKVEKQKVDLVISEGLWIGRTLKYQYLFEQMKKIGLQQSEDIFDCFEDIEVPEVSIHVKDQFVPTIQTDNIEWVEDGNEDWEEDNDIIGEYDDDDEDDEDDEDFGDGLQFLMRSMGRYDHEKESAVIIQRIWRGCYARKKSMLDRDLDHFMGRF
jgi:hypothetical protein